MTPTEEAIYRAGVWAERDAYAPVLNAERLAWFNSVKEAFMSRSFVASKVTPPPANVIAMADYSGLQSLANSYNQYGGGPMAWPFGGSP